MTYTPTDIDGTIELIWGGDQRRFRLGMDQLIALEEKRDCPFSAVHQRLMRQEYYLADVTETLRLGLLGAGADPKIARDLVERHCAPGRIEASAVVAFYVLTGALDAPKVVTLAKKDEAVPDSSEASASPSPPSTATP